MKLYPRIWTQEGTFLPPLWICSLIQLRRNTAGFLMVQPAVSSELSYILLKSNTPARKSCRITTLNIYQLSQAAAAAVFFLFTFQPLSMNGGVSGQRWYNRIHSFISLFSQFVPLGTGLNYCSSRGAYWKRGEESYLKRLLELSVDHTDNGLHD